MTFRRVRRWFTPAAAALAAGGLGWALWSRRSAIEAFDWGFSWPAIVGAAALFALSPLIQALSFRILLAELGAPVRFLSTTVVWTRSFLLRYAPTGVMGLAYRLGESGRLGGSPARVVTATVYEQFVALTAGALACACGFLLASSQPPAAAIGILAVALLALAALRPSWGGRLVRPLLRRRGIDVPALVRARVLAFVVALNSAGWAATAAGLWVLLDGIAGPAPDPAWLGGSHAFAWMLGFIVPFLPGGLGLRDGTLAALLAVPYSSGVGAALALAVRLVGMLGELVAAAVAEVAAAVTGVDTKSSLMGSLSAAPKPDLLDRSRRVQQ
jgi:glycosyltransferase 2 family protein